jgi:hypothetical protein
MIGIYIPKIDNNLNKDNLNKILTSIFKEKCINNINFIINKKTNTRMGYIYFNYWPNNKISQSLKKKLINNESIKIVYNYPNYIKLLIKK